jgi:2'-5' RNA ligase
MTPCSTLFTAELYLDPAAEQAIRDLQDEIDRRLARTRNPDRPHLTLAVGDRVDREGVDPVAGLADAIAGEPIVFSSLGQFHGERFVLLLATVVTEALLAFQREVHARLGGGLPAGQDMCAPGRWVPHCTLAMDLDRDDLAVALDVAFAASLPTTAQISGIGIRRYLAAG